MKKLLTLGVVSLLAAVTVSAQGYRKWDFTNWSGETISNLKADAATSSTEGWSDIEKAADAGEGKVAPDATREKCFWLTDANGGELTANGVAIAELEGLAFNSGYSVKRSLAIAIDYPSTTLGEYAGPQYLWLGGGGKQLACFTIPKVRIGQKMTFVVESHKPADARGIELYVGSVAEGNKIGESFKPTTQATYTWEDWTLPEGAVSEDGETVDIIVYNTSGCHLYSIEVGENTEMARVAYIYNGDLTADVAYPMVADGDKYMVDALEATGAFTDELTQYDAVVISSTVTNAEAIASLGSIRPFVPVLNLNPALYEAWGLGTVSATSNGVAVLLKPDHALFRGLDDNAVVEDPDTGNKVLILTAAASLPAVTPAGLFADDMVLAQAYESEAAAIHVHNMAHNGYIYLPYTQETAVSGIAQLLQNAVSLLVGSKAKVTQATKPSFSLEYKNLLTNVTITSSVPGAQIFYTIDGSEPTAASTPYAGPFSLTQACTVKAVVLGDGYLLSDVAEQLVEMKSQAAMPVIDLAYEDGKTIVTLSSDAPDASIYYNYTGSTIETESSLYSEPFAVDILNRTLYAFAVADGYVGSDLAEAAVDIKNPKVRIDVLAHMDANADEYNNGSTSTAYYFSWGKTKGAYPYYDENGEIEIVADSQGNDSIVYKTLMPEEQVDFGNGWMIGSRGQVVIWEKDGYTLNYGDSNGRNPATVNDLDPNFEIKKYFITLGEKANDVPYSAYIATTQPYAGPFDVVAYVGNGSKPVADREEQDHQNVVFEVSKDKENWEQIGDICDVVGPRLFHKFTRSYEGTDEVYVRTRIVARNSKAQFYEIYIANQGEKSGELIASGISERQVAPVSRKAAVYSLSGERLKAPKRGLNIVVAADGSVRKVVK